LTPIIRIKNTDRRRDRRRNGETEKLTPIIRTKNTQTDIQTERHTEKRRDKEFDVNYKN
jgi:hypothetical protein